MDLIMKPPGGFEPAKPGLVIGKYQIISLLFIQTKRYIKDLKYKLNMINKKYLLPKRTSDYSDGEYNAM